MIIRQAGWFYNHNVSCTNSNQLIVTVSHKRSFSSYNLTQMRTVWDTKYMLLSLTTSLLSTGLPITSPFLITNCCVVNFLVLRRCRLHITVAATAKRQATRPPTTPPAIAPAWVFDAEDWMVMLIWIRSFWRRGGYIRCGWWMAMQCWWIQCS